MGNSGAMLTRGTTTLRRTMVADSYVEGGISVPSGTLSISNSVLFGNVYNIGNALYYAQYYQGHAVPASGRSASLSYRVRW